MNIYTYKLDDGITVLVVAENLTTAKALLHRRLATDGIRQQLTNSGFKLQDSTTRRVDVLV